MSKADFEAYRGKEGVGDDLARNVLKKKSDNGKQVHKTASLKKKLTFFTFQAKT